MTVKNTILSASSTAGGLSTFLDGIQAVATGLVVYAILYLIEKLRTGIHLEKAKRKGDDENSDQK